MKRVQVHIERLVLRGVGGAAPAELATALQLELQHVLAQVRGEGWHHDMHLARLPAGALPIAGPGTPAEVGKRAGLCIGDSLAALSGGKVRG